MSEMCDVCLFCVSLHSSVQLGAALQVHVVFHMSKSVHKQTQSMCILIPKKFMFLKHEIIAEMTECTFSSEHPHMLFGLGVGGEGLAKHSQVYL